MAGLSDLPLKEIPYGQKEVFLITFRVKFGGEFLVLIPLQCNQPVPKQCYAALLQLPRSLGCQPCYISDSFWRQRKLLLFSSKFSLKNEKPLVTAWVLSLEHRFSAAQTGCLGALSSLWLWDSAVFAVRTDFQLQIGDTKQSCRRSLTWAPPAPLVAVLTTSSAEARRAEGGTSAYASPEAFWSWWLCCFGNIFLEMVVASFEQCLRKIRILPAYTARCARKVSVPMNPCTVGLVVVVVHF